jgi:hypothetical protein
LTFLPVLLLAGIAIWMTMNRRNANPPQPGPDADAVPALPASDLEEALDPPATPPSAPMLVGRQVCGECHPENYQSHSRHGHASTFHFVIHTDLVERFAGKQFEAGEDYGTYKYEADSGGKLFVTLESQFGDQPFPLPYALGSGLHAQTMLTLVPGLDGQTEGIEHRVSCYADNRIALTPGHSKKKPRSSLEFFGDASRGQPLQRCIYCHTTRGTVVGEAVQDLIPNVNCEKCHGPGSEHVRLARMNGKPPPYSIGKATWDAESEIQLCGDCHRLPRSVTEQEIREYPLLLVRFQPIGLLRSRCYLGSKRELKCTTCHHPHRSIRESEDADHVRDCLRCHQPDTETHVACPVDPEKGCIECHMPAIETDQGLRFHDHWIRVRED